ncbi:unnamed protein product [Miscanthus lutarioriparius]|uniref:Uncharacterized protein n=1 Tax=Miscanthus lutarioriparius TaxID=422564 RepID=A0A811RTZ4_9POAL|nr:unnamed protein product [Miscanthus lutarioriparius]
MSPCSVQQLLLPLMASGGREEQHQHQQRQPCAGRIRALPSAEVINEILSPKLVPGSPADTGDVSSLVPVSALMLLFYFVSNWVVPVRHSYELYAWQGRRTSIAR